MPPCDVSGVKPMYLSLGCLLPASGASHGWSGDASREGALGHGMGGGASPVRQGVTLFGFALGALLCNESGLGTECSFDLGGGGG